MPSLSPQTLSKASYDRLRSDVADIMAQAQSRAKMVLARELVIAYWQVGTRFAAARLQKTAAAWQTRRVQGENPDRAVGGDKPGHYSDDGGQMRAAEGEIRTAR